jgi:hypothetical protein
MNFQSVIECENAQSDTKRAILNAFLTQTPPPGAHAQGSQTKLSKIGSVAFNA